MELGDPLASRIALAQVETCPTAATAVPHVTGAHRMVATDDLDDEEPDDQGSEHSVATHVVLRSESGQAGP